MASHSGPDIIEDGLVLALDAANTKSYGGSGTTWSDLSGNGNDGTLTNGPTFSSDNLGCIVFDGSDDRVDGVHNSELNLTNDLTVECWFRRTGGRSDWVRVFGKGDYSNRTYGLWYHDNSNYFLYQRYGGSSNMNIMSNKSVVLNTWYHMVGTYKVGYGNAHLTHIGNVSNCRVYNRGLSEAEIKQNFNALRRRFGI